MEKLRNKVHVLQSLSKTRWSTRSDACKALVENYVEVKNTLLDLTASGQHALSAVNEATLLHSNRDRGRVANCFLNLILPDFFYAENVSSTRSGANSKIPA